MRMDYLEEDSESLDEKLMEETEKVREEARLNEELVAH